MRLWIAYLYILEFKFQHYKIMQVLNWGLFLFGFFLKIKTILYIYIYNFIGREVRIKYLCDWMISVWI